MGIGFSKRHKVKNDEKLRRRRSIQRWTMIAILITVTVVLALVSISNSNQESIQQAEATATLDWRIPFGYVFSTTDGMGPDVADPENFRYWVLVGIDHTQGCGILQNASDGSQKTFCRGDYVVSPNWMGYVMGTRLDTQTQSTFFVQWYPREGFQLFHGDNPIPIPTDPR